MITKLSWVAVALALVGCAPMSGTAGADAQQAAIGAAAPACQDSRFPMTIDGKQVETSAHSCAQPDGSLEVVQDTPGLPVETYHVPPLDAACGAAGQAACGSAPAQADAAGCRNYTVPVTVEGASREATRHVCAQPDGSWQVTQTVPGLPTQTYTVPAASTGYPAAAYGYAYPYAYGPYPYWWGWDGWAFGPPFFFGRVAFFDRFHHHDHDHGFHHAHFAGHFSGHHFTGGSGGMGHFGGGHR
jgi:surface antigen